MYRQQLSRAPVSRLTSATDLIVLGGTVLLGVVITRMLGWSLGAAIVLFGFAIAGGVIGLVLGHQRYPHAGKGVSGPAMNHAVPVSPRGADPYDGSSWPRPGHGQ